MTINFEWDQQKATINLQKHEVSFVEASTVFNDPCFLILDDTLHSRGEKRLIVIGYSQKQRLLVVVYTERGYNIRIISARLATKRERQVYEQE